MSDNDTNRDEAVEKELEGVPEEFLEKSDAETVEEDTSSLDQALDRLRDDLETAKQEVLYAKAETQNVRRRLEKDIQDARNYGATGFARDVLSVADNLARAIDAVPEDLREDSKFKGLVTGIQATQRELDKVFSQHGISRIAAMGLPLDPNQHQAMMEVPTNDAEPGTIVQEMQAGYMIKDRLLRPAMVGVAKKPD
ncbi:nucleotide exchange factor GrpE [Aurantiacibacter sp. MUD11]|uniref:nucleotide exchange factor GrpE n=1 Tax=Aurantiacibacter sp. MUD11 TaxID=3003265 RepID=UPI0022AAC78E|nr:nucleotide exchange factor GrpE [Aurantiacibacter sp. MUD11]WAT18369.1 nucleotide exchange factor GrpE [Aurantiacibacter sp. MUD11]